MSKANPLQVTFEASDARTLQGILETLIDSAEGGNRHYAHFVQWLPALERLCTDLEGARRGNDDACPSCGCEPGDGVTEGCTDPVGCGYWKL